jgi:hypothetical protein
MAGEFCACSGTDKRGVGGLWPYFHGRGLALATWFKKRLGAPNSKFGI